MSKLYFGICLLLLSLSSKAQQSINNFTVKEHSIVWQKDISSDVDQPALFEKIILSGILKDAKMFNNIIYGEVRNFTLNYKDYDTKLSIIDRSSLAMTYTGYLTIQKEESNLKIFFSHIGYLSSWDSASPSSSFIELESWALKKDGIKEFSNSFKGNVSYIMNEEFMKVFSDLFKK